ncbi:MAG: DUF5723 family protein [Bacteroidota bacterium]
MKRLFSFFFLVLLFASFTHAQQDHGILWRHSALTGIQIQPAHLIGTDTFSELMIFGFQGSVDNDHLYLEKLFNKSGWRLPNGATSTENQDQSTRSASMQLNVPLPGFLISKGNYAFGAQLAVRSELQLDAASQDIASLTAFGFDQPRFFNRALREDNLSGRLLAWGELKAHFSKLVYEKIGHRLTVGTNAKLLRGMGGLQLNAPGSDYMVLSKDELMFFDTPGSYHYSDNLNRLDQDNTAKGAWGAGIDLGIQYTYQPTGWSAPKFRVGLSLLDLGQINFANSTRHDVVADGYWNVEEVPINHLEVFRDTILFRYGGNLRPESLSMNLPTRLSFQSAIWYNAFWHTDILAEFNLVGNENQIQGRNRYQVTTMWEKKKIGVAIPIGYNNWQGFQSGLFVRFGRVQLGTQHLPNWLARKTRTGADIYGAFILNW